MRYYNLKIGGTRYENKTHTECVKIIISRHSEIAAACLTPAAFIRAEIISMPADVKRLAYYDKNGKVFLSINRKGA